MTWRNHYMRCTRVNWAMSLSGCGIPMLKLKICLLQLEVKTSLSDWGERDGIELAAGRLQMQDEMAGNMWVSPHADAKWCCSRWLQTEKTCPALSGETGFYIWSCNIYYYYQCHAHQYALKVRTDIQKCSPVPFPAFGPYNSALKCSTVCLIW